MNNQTQTMSTQDLYRNDTPVTPIQSGAFNTILTHISKHTFILQQEQDLPAFLVRLIESKKQTDHTNYQADSLNPLQEQNHFLNLVNNWHILLNHIYTILLPELYVFFHDDTCTTSQRKAVHTATEDIWTECQTWQFDMSHRSEYTPLQKQIIANNSTHLPQADDYLIGKGDNADIACRILPLAKLSDIDGFHYLQDLKPLFQTLSQHQWLLDFISLDGSIMVQQLDDWQTQRLSHFSVPDTQTLYNQPNLLFSNVLHPVIRHIQQNMDNSHIIKVRNSSQIQALADDDSVVIESNRIKQAVFFGGLGLLTLLMAIWLHFVFGVVAIVLFLLAGKQIKHILIRSTENDSTQDTSRLNHDKNNQQDTPTSKPEAQVLLPISLHCHGYYLAQLLSSSSIERLNTLISEVNQAHAHLDYLEEHHPYLATSVHELIMDITVNSILRLDQLAKNVQTNDTKSAKALFATNHEPHVVYLLNHHLQELQALNASIVEKQMAEFRTVGDETERAFRNSIMELRILLKWFIAQTPDTSIGVSKDAVILERLESSTLKQMQTLFYQAGTTDKQRAELQQQIEQLLAHFQAQSPKHSQLEGSDDLLKLSDSHLLHQPETQSFIDFNRLYIKQLKQHW